MKRAVLDGSDQFVPPFFVTAVDPDSNDSIIYSVIDHSKNDSGISIDEQTGELQLTKPLK
jgi:hypothetical protein